MVLNDRMPFSGLLRGNASFLEYKWVKIDPRVQAEPADPPAFRLRPSGTHCIKSFLGLEQLEVGSVLRTIGKLF